MYFSCVIAMIKEVFDWTYKSDRIGCALQMKYDTNYHIEIWLAANVYGKKYGGADADPWAVWNNSLFIF